MLETEDIDVVEQSVGYCLIGYFAGRFPGRQAVIHLCDSWQVKYEYHVHTSEWFIFKLESEASFSLSKGSLFSLWQAFLI